jgi:hypothetical protein
MTNHNNTKLEMRNWMFGGRRATAKHPISLILPPPQAGEGWGGGLKTRLTPERSITGLIILLSLLLAGCSGLARQEGGDIYLPPTPAGGATPLIFQPTPTPIQDQASTLAALLTPTPPCADGLRYIEDLSIPDSSQVSSGERLDKRWSVENNGSCNWDKDYRLKLVAGPELGAPVEQALYPARSGSLATIRIIFTAPSEPGVYRSAWQAYNSDGQPFGDPVFIEIQVGG